ncbi:hypothetical protein HKK58_05095 [Pseudomonas sp. ADAK22]|uniref:hypothetical protein n=1 Tax=Pseudomonas sp. ADAK22 TaxID=2730851 RepID=UPI001463E18F|nr:hypothetical protein [Pseudomonas sp. ADAK22]QJI11931.1 hypothetical protein HKK58_05095 [Pseudomonas sp. ADAK22]
MKIKLFPFLTDDTISASVHGDIIAINGELYDLSGIPEGYRLPASAVGSDWLSVSDFVERVGGEISLTLKYPVQWDSPVDIRTPDEPIVLSVTEGAVKFPTVEPVKNG